MRLRVGTYFSYIKLMSRHKTTTSEVLPISASKAYELICQMESYPEFVDYYLEPIKLEKRKKNSFLKQIKIKDSDDEIHELLSIVCFYPEHLSFRAHLIKGDLKELHWHLKIAPIDGATSKSKIVSAHVFEVSSHQNFLDYERKIKNIEESLIFSLKNYINQNDE